MADTVESSRKRLLEAIDALSQTTRQKERDALWVRIHAGLSAHDAEVEALKADNAALLGQLRSRSEITFPNRLLSEHGCRCGKIDRGEV